MSEGLASFEKEKPIDSYYIWRYKGTDELLFLGDSAAAQASFATAAEWAKQSDAPEAEIISELSHRTSEYLLSNPDSRIAQIDAWSSLLSTALDSDTRDRAVARIESLGGSVVFSEDGRVSIQYEKADSSTSGADDSHM